MLRHVGMHVRIFLLHTIYMTHYVKYIRAITSLNIYYLYPGNMKFGTKEKYTQCTKYSLFNQIL
jgi:hypothetical protein